MKVPINGCRWCGILEREHCSVYSPKVGYHTYIAPDDLLRIERYHKNKETT